MEQDNENRQVESVPPVEHDLFTLNDGAGGQNPAAEPEKTADMPAAPVAEADPVSGTEPESGTESLREPEFKVNQDDRPPVRQNKIDLSQRFMILVLSISDLLQLLRIAGYGC